MATFLNKTDQLLAVLCDGMGGHNAGDVASEMAALQLGNSWRETSFSEISTAKEWLHRRINRENKRIYDAASTFPDLDGMGTTLVIGAFLSGQILIGNVGDSRAYQFNGKQIKRITEDHSFANELRIQGQISEEEALLHDKKNTLTRSLGVETEVCVDFFECTYVDTTLLLLCSDGLTNTVTDEEIESILIKESSIEEKSQLLVEAAKHNGGTDNISVCLIQPEASSVEQKMMKGGEVNGER